jgi:uncharacterized protein (TIGR00304 family)
LGALIFSAKITFWLCLLRGLSAFQFEVSGVADLGVFYAVGFVLVLAGIALIVAAMIRASTYQHSEKEEEDGERHVKAAGVIMIGPIPIIFGTDKKSVKPVLALALALSIVFLIILLIYYGSLGNLL